MIESDSSTSNQPNNVQADCVQFDCVQAATTSLCKLR